MKDPKNSRDKLNNLIEAFSELTEEDMEEARGVILAAGKDPEEILRRGAELVKAMRKQRSGSIRRYEGNSPLRFFAGSQKSIVLTHESGEGARLLGLQEVYSLLMQKPEGTEVSMEASLIRLLRYVKPLCFNIVIGAEYASVECMLDGVEGLEVPVESISLLADTGYLISTDTCYPLEGESLVFAKSFAAELDSGNNLPLRKALNYFAKKEEYRYLRFAQDGPDMRIIFDSARYEGSSRLFIRDLYDYQKDGLKWLMYCCINRLGGILADDMGLGKTAQIVALIAGIIERNILGQILIVVPSTLLENWRREFLFFAPEIVPYIHHGANRTGSPATLAQHRVIVTAYSMIINDLYLFNKLQWGLIILDEASLIKNPESERKSVLDQLDSEVNIAMTGTPVENSILDLWSIADFVRKGYLGTRTDFSARYKPKAIAAGQIEHALEPLRSLISFMMLRRRKEAVLDSLPERIDIHQALEMTGNEAAEYEFKRKAILSESSMGHRGAMLRSIVEMRMFATHPLLRDRTEIRTAGIQRLSAVSTKFGRTVELLSQIRTADEKVLIFTEFVEMIDAFVRTLGAYFKAPVWTIDGRVKTEERQLNIDRFSVHEGFAVMILNPRTAGMGLNITSANHVIHYTRQWNPALEEQASARAYRNGQKKGVNIYYLYYSDTIEDVIDARLRHKKSVSDEVIADTGAENMDEYISALQRSPLK